MQKIARDEVLSNVLVEDAPIARLVLVDRLDVAADQGLVLLQGLRVASSSCVSISESTAVSRTDEGRGSGRWKLEVGDDN
jgi:hypothetical protein